MYSSYSGKHKAIIIVTVNSYLPIGSGIVQVFYFRSNAFHFVLLCIVCMYL